MEDKARRLLNKIQMGFPLEARPYLAIASELEMTEDEVIELIKQLKETGYIRRLGGVFDSKSLGYTSRLCALQVKQHHIEKTAHIINSYEGVTHNYLRSHRYNMWFTLAAPSKTDIETILEDIKLQLEVNDMMILEGLRTFKIKVNFHLGGK